MTARITEQHLPKKVFEFCLKNQFRFEETNERNVDLDIKNDFSGRVSKAVRSQLQFIPKDDGVEINMKLFDRTGVRVLECSELFSDKIWKFSSEAGFIANHETILDNFIRLYHNHLSFEQREELKGQIVENPENIPGLIPYFRYGLRCRMNSAIEEVQYYFLNEKPSYLSQFYYKTLSLLPRKIAYYCNYYKDRLEHFAEHWELKKKVDLFTSAAPF